jgi:hypothetical protein
VYDLASQRRVQRIALRSPGMTLMGVAIEFGQGWIWPFDRLYDWLLGLVPELGVGGIAVTQDARPLLVTGADFTGSLAVYDALSGAFLRRVTTGNLTNLGLATPWTGEAAP